MDADFLVCFFLNIRMRKSYARGKLSFLVVSFRKSRQRGARTGAPETGHFEPIDAVFEQP
ncbi:MAG: hypothetical protein AMJ91_04495 [candidate division Zixibacteria bacterium SM23_73_3]|nr:MAG: hypothetical protein AMJ91_04495 [candidate division Zixibacteria bacterium SM23_73_3]